MSRVKDCKKQKGGVRNDVRNKKWLKSPKIRVVRK